ncbi:MAG: ribbon-helix-helix domain-containing protein [Alphaproteobacteria bacterium]
MNSGQGPQKRSVVVAGHRTSVSLEPAFWEGLRVLARVRGLSVNETIAEIDRSRDGSLSSALRVAVLAHFRGALAGQGIE